MEALRIILASRFLLGYPQGGGHWSAFLQHLLGLAALGHDVFWLELHAQRPETDLAPLQRIFAARMAALGFADRWAIALYPRGAPMDFDRLQVVGADRHRLGDRIRSADLLWNFACAIKPPLLDHFARRALIDGDPGIVQISAEQHDLAVSHHDVCFTAGLRVGASDCPVPTGGRHWHPFPQFVHLPSWPEQPPPIAAPFTSITQWGWGEISHRGKSFSVSKRDAYLHFINLPRRTGRRFELAANIDPRDPTGDRARLQAAGWALVDPHAVAGDPAGYQRYLAGSRAEICCPKPVYVDLRTGWFSDRSAGYLATGRPVAMQDTGLQDRLPTGTGLLTFSDEDSAVAAIESIERDYAAHARAAHALAVEHLAAATVLPRMIELCR